MKLPIMLRKKHNREVRQLRETISYNLTKHDKEMDELTKRLDEFLPKLFYRCENPIRTRVMCPYHKHLCYGEKQEFYDTTRIFFDCGTMVDYGYGYYEPPALYKSITIFKDETGFTAWVPRAGWTMLARQVPLEKARRIARQRLSKGGCIKEKLDI